MRRWLIFLSVWLCAGARAEEAPAAAADSISKARKDLATIKAPLPQPEGSGSLPGLDLRDLSPLPASVRPEAPNLLSSEKDAAADPLKKKIGTGNWLVDAMEKRSDGTEASRGREKDEILKGDPALLPKADERLTLGWEQERTEEGAEKSVAKETGGPVYNPLDSFMSGWISARDHDLLLTAKGEGPGGVEAGHTKADLLPGFDSAPNSVGDELAAPPDGALADGHLAANPYLADLDPLPASPVRIFFPPEVPGLDGAGPADQSHGLSTGGMDSRSLDNSRSFIPDFAQPSDDDKYFKQMKRF